MIKYIMLIQSLIVSLIIMISFTPTYAEVPSWVKQTAILWGNDQISDDEFLAAIQYLIDLGILTIGEISIQVDHPENVHMGVTIKNGFELDNIPEEHVKLMLKDMHEAFITKAKDIDTLHNHGIRLASAMEMIVDKYE